MYFAHNIRLWHVYLCPACNLSEPPKDKWVVTVGMSGKDKIYGFFINTEINSYLRRSEELLQLQIPILHGEHAFLKYDSYINCAKFLDFYPSDLRNPQKDIPPTPKSVYGRQ